MATGEGRTVKMTGRISGVDKWSGDYSVVVAGFDDESDYAIVSKVVPASESANDEIQLTMSVITDEVKMCIRDRHCLLRAGQAEYSLIGTWLYQSNFNHKS